jgi:hypothetical protein
MCFLPLKCFLYFPLIFFIFAKLKLKIENCLHMCNIFTTFAPDFIMRKYARSETRTRNTIIKTLFL